MSTSNCEPCIIDPTESTILLNLVMCEHLYFIFPATFQWIKLCKHYWKGEVSGKKSYYSFFQIGTTVKNNMFLFEESHIKSLEFTSGITQTQCMST